MNKLVFLFLTAALNLSLYSQTPVVVYSDDFSTNTSAAYSGPSQGPIGTSDWNVFTSLTGDVDWGARRNVNPQQLELSNDISGSSNGVGSVTAFKIIDFASPYQTNLSQNPGKITWNLNMRQIRTDPAGFGVGAYGMAYVLATNTVPNFNTASGFALALGQPGAIDPLRLVYFTGGLRGTLTNIIVSNTTGLADFGAEYLSVRVTYDPSNDQWELSVRNDGNTAFADPTTGTLVSQGVATFATGTNVAYGVTAAYWQGSTAANQTAFFDNISVIVEQPPSPGTVQFTLSEYSGLENGGPITVSVRRTGGADGAISVDYGEQVVVGGRNDKARNVRPELREEFKKWLAEDVCLFSSKPITVPVKNNGEQTVSFEGRSWILSYGSVRFKNTDPDNFVQGSCSDPECVDITEIPESFLKGPSWVELPVLFSDTPTFGDAQAIGRRADLRSGISNLSSAILVGERTGRPLTQAVPTSENALADERVFAAAIGGGTATGGASCTAGVDYITPSGTLNWADGDSADKTFNITICPDSDFEPDETFTIELTNPTGGATIGMPSTATVTILNDDPEPVVPIIVTTNGDAGDANPGDGSCATAGGECTLRAAVEEANALPGEQTIEIQLSGLGVPDVITLTSGNEIAITDDLIINGPGADQLTIDGGPGTNRIFSAGSGVSLELSGITLTGGNGTGAADSGCGGAVRSFGDLTLDGVNIAANDAAICGGAIAVSAGTHFIRNSTISGNGSDVHGGGLFSAAGAIVSIENTTISGNTAVVQGGGIFHSGDVMLISNSTILSNDSSDLGGGVQNSGSGLTIRSTIIAGNLGVARPDISNDETVTSGGFNLIGDDAGDSANTGNAITYQSTDILDTPPLLGSLQNNGGPTPTHRPSALSPVIDAGDSFGLMTDQHGFARVFDFPTIFNVGDGADIGAFENLGPSRAAIDVSGRVMTAEGMPIRGATLTVHGGAFTEPRTFVSGSMGTFELVGLRAGETYFIYVSAGRYTFAEPWRTFTALDSITDMEIIGVAQF